MANSKRLLALILFALIIMALPAENYSGPNLKIVGRFEAKNAPQLQAFTDTHSDLLNDGPWGTGKTHMAAVKAYCLAKKYPGLLVGLIRKKRIHLEATLWEKFVKILPPEDVAKSNDTKLSRTLLNGSEIHGLGLDSENAVNLMDSREFGFVVIEEAKEIDEATYVTKIKRCMRQQFLADGTILPFRQVVSLTNPGSPGHFLYKDFISNPKPGYHRIQGERLPDLPRDYIEMIDSLTGVWRLRYRDGLWTAFEGQVYPYNPDKHLINRSEAWEGWENWRSVVGVDFGFDHPFVCQWWKVSPSGIWIMYREIYMSRRTVNKHAPLIKKFCDEDNIEPRIICDHDAEDSATLREYGLYTVKAKKDRLAGQNAVYELFEQDRIFFMRDSLVETDQRLVVEKRPTCTVEEFDGYVWATTTKEDMIKEKDDGMDTKRYCVYTDKNSGVITQRTGRY